MKKNTEKNNQILLSLVFIILGLTIGTILGRTVDITLNLEPVILFLELPMTRSIGIFVIATLGAIGIIFTKKAWIIAVFIIAIFGIAELYNQLYMA